MQRHRTYKYKVIHSGDIPSVIQMDVTVCVAFSFLLYRKMLVM